MGKRKGTWLTASSRMCPLMLACEGSTLKPGRNICGPCEQAEKKRRPKEIKLRGEHHLAYEASRNHFRDADEPRATRRNRRSL